MPLFVLRIADGGAADLDGRLKVGPSGLSHWVVGGGRGEWRGGSVLLRVSGVRSVPCCVMLWVADLWMGVSWVSGLRVPVLCVCVLLWMCVSWVSGLGVPVLCVCVLLWMGVSWVFGLGRPVFVFCYGWVCHGYLG